MNENRTKLIPTKIINNTIAEKLEVANVMFAYGLGKVTDMDEGPDGKLYIHSKYLDTPTIFRISSVNGTK